MGCSWRKLHFRRSRRTVFNRDHTHHEAWLKTDPQQPKSIWWYSDIKGIGFRVVCEPDSLIIQNKY